MRELSEEQLWHEWTETREARYRDQLATMYEPLVRQVAARVAQGLPGFIDVGDLVGYGMFGLLDAIDRFDHEHGARFSHFASPRIKGAILDELRSIDWVPRSVRARIRRVEETRARLEGELYRQPTSAEIARQLGLPEEEVYETLASVTHTQVEALDHPSDGLSLVDTVAGDGPVPGGGIEVAEACDRMADALERLTEREHVVFSLYYFEECSVTQIATILGVTESRVVQIQTEYVRRLRGLLV